MTLDGWKFKGWTVCGIALLSFGFGALLVARLAHMTQARADSAVFAL